MPLYPFKFKPRFVEKIWGGRKIETVLSKPLPPRVQVGESWELYDFPPGVVEGSSGWVSSEVINGPFAGRTLHEIVTDFPRELLGDVRPIGLQAQFPILIKFLDAREDLSVQVHPDEDYANTHPGAHLKTEAWYVLQADPGARLLKGLKPGTTRGASPERRQSEGRPLPLPAQRHGARAGSRHPGGRSADAERHDVSRV
jgi:mannose-6-phosphate isomerase